MLRLPLHDLHRELGASFGEFAGWEAPINYGSVLEEHMAVRRSVGVFDLSHMGRILLRGEEEAYRLLDRLVPRIIDSEPRSMVGPTAFLNEHAGFKDDVMLYHGSGYWLVVPNAVNRVKIYEWLAKWNDELGAGASISDETMNLVLIAIQGPCAVKAVKDLGAPREALDLPPLRFLEDTRLEAAGARAMILSRSGWTGEDGFEIITWPGDGEKIIRYLHDKGYQLCGLGARDSLRMEIGFLLYGHEIDEDTTPVEARYWWVFRPGPKEDCIGCRALREALRRGASRIRVGLKMSKKARIVPRQGDKILVEGVEVGYVTSGAYSPLLKRSLGQGYVKPSHALLGMEVEILHRGKRYRAKIAEPPFIQPRSSLGRPACSI